MSYSKATVPVNHIGSNPYGYIPSGTIAGSTITGSTASGTNAPVWQHFTVGHGYEDDRIELPAATINLPMKLIISSSGDDVTVNLFDIEAGVKVKMELAPEADISPLEQLRLGVMLQTAGGPGASSFKPLAYARKHHIDRHFRLSVA